MAKQQRLIVVLSMFYSVYSYSSAELVVAGQKKVVLPHALYDDAWPEAAYCISLDEAALQETIVEIRKQKKELADKEEWPEDVRRMCDWIYAAGMAEHILFPKPLAEWTVNAIRMIARGVTRFSVENPGGDRKDATHDFEALLSMSLKQCQELLAKIPADCIGLKRELKILNVAASLHFDLARFAPFEKHNEDIGRLLMNVILAQEGLPIIRYPVLAEYTKALEESVRTGNPSAFWMLTSDAFNNTRELFLLAEQQGKDFYREQAKLIRQQHDQTLGNQLGTIALQKKIELIRTGAGGQSEVPHILVADLKNDAEVEALRQKLRARLQNLTFKCEKCAEGGTKLICSGCKTVAYCSAECQKADWAKHKPNCQKKAPDKKE